MSSSSSSSDSSSSSSSSFQGGNDNANVGGSGRGSTSRGRAIGTGGASSSRQRGTDFEGPSSSRRRATSNEVWLPHFVEALAAQVATEAARSIDRLAAAPALVNVFRVCNTWRDASRSDLLWHRITRRVWGRTHLRQATWRDEYIFWHRTARNFRTRRSSHTVLHFNDAPPEALICRCLTLSETHLACGFADGSVRLFHLPTCSHVTTYRPHPRPLLGPFSRAVTGIVFANNHRLVFATLDGDIHVAIINGSPHPRRAHVGHVVDDGVLVDFAGCGRWWVGLYAGVPGRAFHVWDSNTEELVFVNGTLTEPDSVMGWQMLIELDRVVGRVRFTSRESAVACTSSRSLLLDLRNQLAFYGEEEHETGLMVTTLDVSNSAFIMVDNRGVARVRRAETLEEVCSFRVRRGAWQRGLIGCMNRGYALMCAGGVIRVWELEHGGQYLYRFTEDIGDANAMVADERYVVACSNDATLHIWDFGAQ